VKIRPLSVDPAFQPPSVNFTSPPHNEQWSVEQDWEAWLYSQHDLLTDNPHEADWEYLPLYWNRTYINYGWGEGMQPELQREIERCVSRNRRTFTICEYDVREMQPHLDLCGMTVFTASRRGADTGIDIPLLCTPHMLPATVPDKRLRASFIGNLDTWGIRSGMRQELGDLPDVYLAHDQRGTGFFVNLMLASYIALAPRGHGGQSFRFYEAMQLGTVPLYISDIDCRPFKKWIDWDACSLYLPSLDGLRSVVMGTCKERLLHIGANAARVYNEHLRYGQWCRYVIKELEAL
jgi:hypothetical protein